MAAFVPENRVSGTACALPLLYDGHKRDDARKVAVKMATVSRGQNTGSDGLEPLQPWRVFSETERQQMLKDDMGAGITIALILTGVICAGLVLMLIGVTLSL
jgi:hypothetical protein